MSPTPDLVRVYRKSTGEKLPFLMHREDVAKNPALAIRYPDRDPEKPAPKRRARKSRKRTIPTVIPAEVDALTDADDTPQMSADQVEQTQSTHDDPSGSEHEKE